MFASNLSKTLGGAASLLIGLALLMPTFSFALDARCFCVLWLREVRGIDIRGDAWTLKPSKPLKMATEGDVLLTTEGPGHAAEIIGFEGLIRVGDFTHPAFIRVIEANYSRCKVGTRLIPWNSPEIKGIY